MLYSSDGKEISFPPGLVPQGTILYKLLYEELVPSFPTGKEEIPQVPHTLAELNVLKNYLSYGIVTDPTLDILLELLDYYGIYAARATYPAEFFILKLKEEFYRKNLYNPAFDKHQIQNDTYGLVDLRFLSEKEFELANNVHFLYATYLWNTWEWVGKGQAPSPPVNERLINLVTDQGEPIYDDVSIFLPNGVKPSVLMHTYLRPYITIPLDISINEVKQYIKNVRKGFNLRDDKFENKVVRESVRFFGNGSIHQQLIGNAKRIPFDFKINLVRIYESFANDPVLNKIKNWDNLLLAGGFVNKTTLQLSAETDYDFFIYGLNPIQANRKLDELVPLFKSAPTQWDPLGRQYVSRSKNALTIKYWVIGAGFVGYKKIQFILRLYKTKSEILHGFDVDSSSMGYYGKSVLLTARAIYSLQEMTNTVDFDRMSPSYEARLIKYMTRGYSVYVPDLERERIVSPEPEGPILAYNQLKTLTGLSKLLYYQTHTYSQSFNETKHDFTEPSDYEAQRGFTGGQERPFPDGYIQYPDREISGRFYFAPGIDRYSNRIIMLEGTWDKIRNVPAEYLTHLRNTGMILEVPREIEWKTINPGEQATGTFHKLVYKDLSKWYKGPLYV
jgi:hypothetical protein